MTSAIRALNREPNLVQTIRDKALTNEILQKRLLFNAHHLVKM